MSYRHKLQELLQRFGYQLVRYPIRGLLREYDINVVLDVGANTGQYGQELRKLGYDGRIVSFEPMSDAFAVLQKNAANDQHWTAMHFGLGATQCQNTINVAGNSASSSLLPMTQTHIEAAPHSKYVDQETIEIKKLDDVYADVCKSTDRVLLKVDTQGYEAEILGGAANVLPELAAMQIELSLSSVYEGAPFAEEIIAHLRSSGFVPYTFINGFKEHSTGRMLQMDGLFISSRLNDLGTQQ